MVTEIFFLIPVEKNIDILIEQTSPKQFVMSKEYVKFIYFFELTSYVGKITCI